MNRTDNCHPRLFACVRREGLYTPRSQSLIVCVCVCVHCTRFTYTQKRRRVRQKQLILGAIVIVHDHENVLLNGKVGTATAESPTNFNDIRIRMESDRCVREFSLKNLTTLDVTRVRATARAPTDIYNVMLSFVSLSPCVISD